MAPEKKYHTEHVRLYRHPTSEFYLEALEPQSQMPKPIAETSSTKPKVSRKQSEQTQVAEGMQGSLPLHSCRERFHRRAEAILVGCDLNHLDSRFRVGSEVCRQFTRLKCLGGLGFNASLTFVNRARRRVRFSLKPSTKRTLSNVVTRTPLTETVPILLLLDWHCDTAARGSATEKWVWAAHQPKCLRFSPSSP